MPRLYKKKSTGNRKTKPKHQSPHIPRNPPKNEYQEQDVHALFSASQCFHPAFSSLTTAALLILTHAMPRLLRYMDCGDSEFAYYLLQVTLFCINAACFQNQH